MAKIEFKFLKSFSIIFREMDLKKKFHKTNLFYQIYLYSLKISS